MARIVLNDEHDVMVRKMAGNSELCYLACPLGSMICYENDETPGHSETSAGFVDQKCYACCEIQNETFCPLHVELYQKKPCWKMME